jgi:phosphatidate cytidylyltransferase
VKDLTQRTITGILFVAVVIGAIMWNKYSVAALFFVVSILGLLEFYKLSEAEGSRYKPQKVMGLASGIIIYFLVAFNSFGDVQSHHLLFIFPVIISIVIVELFRKTENPLSNIGFTILGLLYIICPFAILNYFAYDSAYYQKAELEMYNYDYSMLLGFFVILWANDTGAYLVGSTMGRTKLFERISPNKTWEGSVGGAILGLIVGYLFAYFTDSSVLHWLVISGIIVVFGTLGDLSESMIKRSAGVKDSGTLLPGHGGILDRFDGVLFSAPFVLTYFFYLTYYDEGYWFYISS